MFKAASKAITYLVRTGSHTATVYLSEKQTVRATRVKYRGSRATDKLIDVRLTIGRPNYAARQFIKDCKAAGEPFPIRQVHIQGSAK